MQDQMFSQMAAGMGISEDQARKEMELTPALICSFFGASSQQYGSVENFMEKELGIGKKELKQLRNKYMVKR